MRNCFFLCNAEKSEGWSYLIAWASLVGGVEDRVGGNKLVWNHHSEQPKAFNWLGILILTYAWAETNEIFHHGGQVVAEFWLNNLPYMSQALFKSRSNSTWLLCWSFFSHVYWSIFSLSISGGRYYLCLYLGNSNLYYFRQSKQ